MARLESGPDPSLQRESGGGGDGDEGDEKKENNLTPTTPKPKESPKKKVKDKKKVPVVKEDKSVVVSSAGAQRDRVDDDDNNQIAPLASTSTLFPFGNVEGPIPNMAGHLTSLIINAIAVSKFAYYCRDLNRVQNSDNSTEEGGPVASTSTFPSNYGHSPQSQVVVVNKVESGSDDTLSASERPVTEESNSTSPERLPVPVKDHQFQQRAVKVSRKKGKHGRREKVQAARELDGHRAEEDIDKIVEFVERKEISSEDPAPAEEKPKKRKKKGGRRKNKTRLSTSSSPEPCAFTPPPTPPGTVEVVDEELENTTTPPDSLIAFAEKAGFKLNVQYGEAAKGGGVDINDNVIKTRNLKDKPLALVKETSAAAADDEVTLEGTTDSGTGYKMTLVDFNNFPTDEKQQAFSMEELDHAVRMINRRAEELKRMAREGMITSKFI